LSGLLLAVVEAHVAQDVHHLLAKLDVHCALLGPI
jgi:hypothetical protein